MKTLLSVLAVPVLAHIAVFPCTAQEKPPVSIITPLPSKDADAIQLIGVEELQKFSIDWTAYAAWLKKAGRKEGVAYADVSPSSDYSKASRKWIEKRGWTVDRFFYVERLIRETLSYLIQVEKRDEYVRQIESQVKAIRSSSAIPDAQKDRMEEQLRLTVSRKEEYVPPHQPVTDEELELIKANRQSLSELMAN